MRHFILIGSLFTLMMSACIPSSQRVYSSSETLNRRSPRSNSQAPVPSAKPGSCYAKAMSPDNHIIEEISLPVYTGDAQSENSNVEPRTIILSPYSQKWVKKTDVNCLSKNPDDCLIWCLVEVPKVEETLDIVIDTTLTSDYTIKEFTKIIEYHEGETIWTEVVCEKNLQPVLDQVSSRLVELMYLQGPSNSQEAILNALKEYQVDKRLPSGSLNFETLDMLGVAY